MANKTLADTQEAWLHLDHSKIEREQSNKSLAATEWLLVSTILAQMQIL